MNDDPLVEIPKLEREWMSAWIAKDLATCDRILDDDFLLSSARGVLMPKAQWLAGAASTFNCVRFDWLQILVRPFNGFVIAHSRIDQQASVGGQDWSGVFMLTDVWVPRETGWRVVARHGTGPLTIAT